MDLIEQGKELAQSGNFAEALETFKKALNSGTKTADVYFFIGSCYSSMGDFPVAKYYYQEALKIDPEHSRTKIIWSGLDEVEARPPSGAKQPSKSQADSIDPNTIDRDSTGSNREPPDKWSEAFPDQILEKKRSKAPAILLWILIVLVVAAIAYFQLGPRFLK